MNRRLFEFMHLPIRGRMAGMNRYSAFHDPYYYPFDSWFHDPYHRDKRLDRWYDYDDYYDDVMQLEDYEPASRRKFKKGQIAHSKVSQKSEEDSAVVSNQQVENISKNGSPANTYDRAQKLFNELETTEKPTLSLEESDELLQGRNDYEHLFDYFGKDAGSSLTGSTYQSSTIFKNGKAVTITRHSKLNPDGTIKTEVSQEYKDKTGHRDARTWTTEDESFKKKIEGKKMNGMNEASPQKIESEKKLNEDSAQKVENENKGSTQKIDNGFKISEISANKDGGWS